MARRIYGDKEGYANYSNEVDRIALIAKSANPNIPTYSMQRTCPDGTRIFYQKVFNDEIVRIFPRTPSEETKATVWGSVVWIAGQSRYGCLGTMEDYTLHIVGGSVELYWPVIDKYTLIPYLPNNIVWASTDGESSFLIDTVGKMYYCGSNVYGQLGVGRTMGWDTTTVPGQQIPNYYSTTFLDVGGDNWKMVAQGTMYNYPEYTWALKKDGTLLVAGAIGGGIGLGGTGDIATFTKVNNDVWRTIMPPYLIKDSATKNSYDIYIGNPSGITFLMTVSSTDWPTYFGISTPEQYAAAARGFFGFMTIDYLHDLTFIGSSCVDLYPKPIGTLWEQKNDMGGEPPFQGMKGVIWKFTAGLPVRDPGVGIGITGGAVIAIESRIVQEV